MSKAFPECTQQGRRDRVILIIEDDGEAAELVRQALAPLECRVYVAENGKIAMGHCDFNRPDLILLDVQLPGTTGLTVLEQLRNEGQQAPCILISEYIDKKICLAAVNLRVAGMIEKPANPDTIFGTAKRLFDSMDDEDSEQVRLHKLATIGEMASSINHEVGNRITALMAQTELAQRSLNSGSPDFDALNRHISRIRKSAQTLGKITLGMRHLSGEDHREPLAWVPLHPIIENAISLASPVMQKYKIQFDHGPIPTDIDVFCRPIGIEQVLLNLLLNAAYAASTGTARWVQLNIFMLAQKSIISVSDSGPGIPDSLKPRLFKQAFTTKPAGLGSGLGLKISELIMREQCGEIWLCKESRNTTFSIQLGARSRAIATRA